MSDERLCQRKSALLDCMLKIVDETHHVPAVRMELDFLKCPNGHHCDPTKPCVGFSAENRQRISKIEDKLFELGFMKEEQP